MQPLTTSQKAELEAKIREAATPNATLDENTGQWYVHDGDGGFIERPLQLSDVLIAYGDRGYSLCMEEQKHKRLLFIGFHNEVHYDLTKDYHHQSDEFYGFLYSLLL